MTEGASFGGQQAREISEDPPQETTPATVYIPLIQD
jgi:hypothetical protein